MNSNTVFFPREKNHITWSYCQNHKSFNHNKGIQYNNKAHRNDSTIACFSHQKCCCGIYTGTPLSPHRLHPAEPCHLGNHRLDCTLMCLYTQCHHGDLHMTEGTASHKATPAVHPHSLNSDKKSDRMMKQS